MIQDSFDLDARDAWNAGADAFADFVDSGADYYRGLVHGPALLAACGDVRGASVLDLGCGHGYFSRLLAGAEASVLGVDVSEALLERAIEREAADALGIEYRLMDAAQVGSGLEGRRFDLVTGCMSLQDMSEPAEVFTGVSRLLGAGGRMVFSVPHPGTDLTFREWKRDERGRKLALCLDRYFESGPAVCDWSMARLKYPWKTPFRRHTLAEWSTLIRDAGFVIRSLLEPRPDAALVREHPNLEDCFRMPFFLIFEIVLTTK
ncbi:class I SAM-dependent methyltransferase [Paludisphaera mucosa]|uniref:Class I SAM-dependent methyltransferase n=1 Tax=Paludisphaera mucosa TaxID=3030827 RepID=A0ABT6FHW6_9BACT|nr:class I SAM-dependent methyltransferase [Paludisphaera mucosa]MDG3007178.1 class I SAM-dependent methyltransferase [Paludisphaera mucosa]